MTLAPVRCSMDRVIRTVVGLRPYREAGFRVEADRLGQKVVIHHYGHGGAGLSLSWGTASLAADLAQAHAGRQAAVIGAGIVGLTTARELQRRGFDVTVYARDVPPDTTSDRSQASFTPTHGLVTAAHLTPAWVDQFRRAARIAYREHQRLAGSRYGVSWMDEFRLSDVHPPASAADPLADLLPSELVAAQELLGPGEHPFGTRYATRQPALRFEPSTYLAALVDDVIADRGRIAIRGFDAPAELVSLDEPLIVNCTGLGAGALFGDDTVEPVKGQLTVLVPQPEVNYMVGGMIPRSDGIVLNGGMHERGNWNIEADLAHQQMAVERFKAVFDAMRPADSRKEGN